MKSREIGNISFTEASYDKFTKLTKEQQIEKVYNSLNPKDRKQAEKLLAHIPNGNISGRVQEEAEQDNTASSSAGDAKDNSKGRGAGSKKGEA